MQPRKSRKTLYGVSTADIERLSDRSASGETIGRLIKAGLATEDGCGGWYITLDGQKVVNMHDALGSPVCPNHGTPFDDGECGFCEHDKEFY